MAVDIDHADAAGTIGELDRRNSSDIYISDVEQFRMVALRLPPLRCLNNDIKGANGWRRR